MNEKLLQAVEFFTRETGILSGLAAACGDAARTETAMDGKDIREGSVFDLASVTKLFTGLCAMKLKEEGLLDFSRPVFSYDPRFTRLGDTTVFQLMSFAVTVKTPERLDACPDRETALQALFAAEPGERPERRVYSDIPAMSLKYVIEAAAGIPLYDCVKRVVLDPAGMRETWAAVPPERMADCQDYSGEHRIVKGEKTLRRDIRALQMLTQDLYPELPYFLLGHSMGSFLARQFLCLRGASLSGAVISGTAFHPALETAAGMFLSKFIAGRKGWFYRSPFLNNLALGALNKQFEPARTKVDWLTRDESVVDAYVSDRRTQFVFTCNGFYTLFETLRYLTSNANLEHMPKNLPVLFIAGAKDPVGNNGDGPRKVAAQFKSLGLQDTELKIYEEDRHEVLNELDKETVYADVLHFLEGLLC